MRLLLVEDDVVLAEGLKADLSRAGFAVDVAHDGVDGEFMGNEVDYDAVILDLGLPKKPGLEVLKDWRKQNNTVPVIVLTARDAWNERVDGLRAGADDYLGKPFHVEELLARIDAMVRRRDGRADASLEVAGLRLDEERQEVMDAKDNSHPLTGTEFRLLRYFMNHPGKILSKGRLTAHVYEDEAEHDSNVIEVYVRRLRDKLGSDAIRTQRGQGYVFIGQREDKT
ncbi:MAG TPA: response regulator transcription factor [Gammaproteobacteria bacterium]|nr:response regulator transcription factor [Gammaproteobacteria bacterium]